ncbi:MAG: WYL domain-containing protein [Acholeplasmatales bacterium]|nr:WYL domain-containing protein [Acholeplasmatales bacterium]
MNRAAACIKIIQILSCRDVVSSAELADILEINKRNVREYIKEIETAGYTIISTKGVYGGYKLDKRDILPSVKLNDVEKNVIYNGVNFLNQSPDFLDAKLFEESVGKLMASIQSSNDITPLAMLERFPLAMDKNKLQERYLILSEAISSQIKCEIHYESSNNTLRIHTIHPYKLFVYNGSWFVLAWNETVNEFGYFKLNRIDSILKTKYHFSILKTYNESDYLDSFGMKQNGDYYKVVLELEGLNTVMKERVYGKNQKIDIIDDNHIRFECEMQNKNMIMSFILSFGSKCKVISPDWLIEDIKNELWSTLNLYE